MNLPMYQIDIQKLLAGMPDDSWFTHAQIFDDLPRGSTGRGSGGAAPRPAGPRHPPRRGKRRATVFDPEVAFCRTVLREREKPGAA